MRHFVLAAIVALGFAATCESAAACSWVAAEERLTVTDEGQALEGAAGKPWFTKGEPLLLPKGRYEKFGAPIEMGAMDLAPMVKADIWQGVMVFGDPWEDFEVVVVPVDPKACVFQRYALKK